MDENDKQLSLFSNTVKSSVSIPYKNRKRKRMSEMETHMRGRLVVRGSANDTKICSHCQEEKNISFYGTTNSDNYGRLFTKSICNTCSVHHQIIITKHKKKYGPTKPNQCMICDKETTLQLDHCHETGAFRGWLCINCNIALGRLDNETLLIKALEYTHKDPIPEPIDPQQEFDLNERDITDEME